MRFLLFIMAVSLLSIGQKPVKVREFRIAGHAQGTTYHLLYYATDSVVTLGETDSLFASIDSSLSIYKPYSVISRFNRSGTELQLDEKCRIVVQRSLEIYHESSGMFDITVAPLVQAWGFGTQKITSLPGADSIQSLMPCIGSDKISLSGNRLRKIKPCVQIDVNGIAQGYSVDLLAELLESRNIHSYLVEVGGEIRVKGVKPSGEKMTIGIESPDDDDAKGSPMRTIIQLDNGAVTTSGNYRKFYEAGGKKISHLIDPVSGYPFQNEMISVTVIAKDAITADGYDNAFMGLGVIKGMQLAESKKEMEVYFIYHKPNGEVADTATPGFYKFIRN